MFVAVQIIEGYFLTPRILGGRMRLHPMAVFLGMLIGGKLFGFLGIILAVPAIAVAESLPDVHEGAVQAIILLSRRRHRTHEHPSEIMEHRLSDAADTVLIVQMAAETGDELLAPGANADVPIARKKLSERREP